MAGGGLLNAAGLGASGLLSFLLVVAVTRWLHPAGAGVFLEAVALFSILSNLVEFGADDGMLRFIPRLQAAEQQEEIGRLLMAGLTPPAIAGTVAAVLLTVLAPQLSAILVHGRDVAPNALVPYLRVLAPFLPLSALSTASLAASRGFGTMMPNAVVGGVVRPAVRLVLVSAALAAGMGSAGVALAWALPVVITLAATQWWIGRLRRGRGAEAVVPSATAPRVGRLAAEFWRFSAPRGLSSTFGITVTWLDTLLIGALLTTRQAGIYAAAGRYLTIGYLAIGPIQLVLAPLVSRLLARGEHERAGAAYRTATEWVMVLSWPLYLSLAVFSPLALRVFGPGYQAGQTALLILAMSGMVSTMTGPCLTVLLMGGRSGWTLGVAAVSLTLNVTLNLVLIPGLGIEGAAVAWALSIALVNLGGFVLVRRLMGLSPWGRGVPLVAAAAALCFGGIGLVARRVAGPSVPAFIVGEGVAFILYVAVLWTGRRRLNLPELRGAFGAAARRRVGESASPS